jgi:hypothetical protein
MECLFEKAFASVFAAIERTLGKLLLKNIQQVRFFLLTTQTLWLVSRNDKESIIIIIIISVISASSLV